MTNNVSLGQPDPSRPPSGVDPSTVAVASVVHEVRPGRGLTVCCCRSLFELPIADRATNDGRQRTCTAGAPPAGVERLSVSGEQLADWESRCGTGMAGLGLREQRALLRVAEAVADERQRTVAVAVELAAITERAVVRGGYGEGVEERVEVLWQQLGVVLPTGSVPVATPEHHEFEENVDDCSMCVCGVPGTDHDAVYGPVATPPAESAAEQLLRDIFMAAGPVATPTEPADPTYGRIDHDIQRAVDALAPKSIGSRVAMENTLQARRNAASPVSAVQPDGWGEGVEAADHPVNCECPPCAEQPEER
jgi:hypothetical protein